MDSAVIVLVAIPFIGSAVALFGKLFGGRAFAACSLATFAGSLAALLRSLPAIASGELLEYHLGGWLAPLGIGLYLNGFAWISSALIVVLTTIIGLAALSDHRYSSEFFFFLMILASGMEVVALTGDLFNLFVGFEIVAMAAYVLIAYDRSSESLLAGFKYLVLSSVGILFFLLGIFLVYRDSGTLAMRELSLLLESNPRLASSPAIHLALAALCVGVGVRTAFIPFHTWLPEAHAHAPHPVSAILSGVVIKISFFAIMRILDLFDAVHLDRLFLWIGAVTALVAVVRALAQSDAKRLLAYHSISQMGYVLAAFGSATGLARTAALAHAVNHALFKSLLFLTIGFAVSASGERNLYRIRGLGRGAPVVAIAFFIGAASIAGLPPLNGYASKQLVAAALGGSPAYYLVWLAGAGTVASFIKLSRVFAFRRGVAAIATVERPRPLFTFAVVTLALLCLGFGLFAGPIFGSYRRLLGSGGGLLFPSVYGVEKLLSAALTVAVGVALYFVAIMKRAKPFFDFVNRFSPDLRQVLLLFVAGLLLFSLAAY